MATILTTNDDVTYMTSLGLKDNLTSSSEDGLFFYQRGLQAATENTPILVFCHGYPET
jgi:hypothetical protein